jgi:hypothetical protein
MIGRHLPCLWLALSLLSCTSMTPVKTIAWITLAPVVVSLLAAIIGLMQKLIELGTSKRGG